MQRENENLVDKGWAEMKGILELEMPQKHKEILPLRKLSAIVLLSFFFGIAIGFYLDVWKDHKDPSAMLDIENVQNTTPPSQLLDTKQNINTNTDEDIKGSELNSINEVISVSREYTQKDITNTPFFYKTSFSKKASFERSQETSTNGHSSLVSYQQFFDFGTPRSVANFGYTQEQISDVEELASLEILPQDQFTDSYMPRSDSKIKIPSKWHGSIALLAGYNPSRNTELGSIEAEIKYRLNKSNALGVTFGFGIENDVLHSNVSSRAPEQTIESSAIPAKPKYDLGNAQTQFMTGLMYEYKMSPRWYTSLSTGVTVLQNTYTQDSGNTIESRSSRELVRYHPGAFGSLSLKFRASKHINILMKANKGFEFAENEDFQPGSINQIFSGVSVNF